MTSSTEKLNKVERDDTSVIEDVRNGDINAFEILVERYKDYVFMIVTSHIPESAVDDVAQEAFLRAYKALQSFTGKGAFKHWLAGITSRTCSDYWRKHYRTPEQPVSSITGQQKEWLENVIAAESTAQYHELAKSDEARQLLSQAMAGLSPDDRTALTIVHVEGYSVQEAADRLDSSLIGMKVRLHRARHRLRNQLARITEEEGETPE